MNKFISKFKESKPNVVRYQSKKEVAYKHGLHINLKYDCLDWRTREGRMVKFLRQSLRKYIGETTPASEILMTRIIFKTVRLSLYENHTLLDPLEKLDHYYIPLSNSLRADLQQLADLAKKPSPPDLNQYLREIYGDRAPDKPNNER